MCIIPIFFHPFQTFCNLFTGLFLSLTLISKSEKTLELSLDLALLFKTSVGTMVDCLVSNVNYLKNWHCNFIQKKYGRNRRLPHTHMFCSLVCDFSFCTDSLHHGWLQKVKKMNKSLSKQSKQSLLLFSFFGL